MTNEDAQFLACLLKETEPRRQAIRAAIARLHDGVPPHSRKFRRRWESYANLRKRLWVKFNRRIGVQ